MNKQDFVCIYCKKTVPEVEPALSHVIPDFLGGALELKNAVCKTCNNKINREVEEPIKKPFAYLRSGLNLQSRTRRDIKIPAKVKILGVDLEISLGSEVQIPPFEYQKPNGEKGLVIVGEKNYVEEEKRKIDSNQKKRWKWEDLEGTPKPEIFIEVLPLNVLIGKEGQRLAAKIAFERFCQMRSASSVLDNCYDQIREFIVTGNAQGIFSNLFFDDKVMNRNFDFLFPWHGIVFMQRGYKLVSIVTLFGLFYFLVVLTTRARINANWEECILIHPQTKQKIVPVLGDSLSPTIPASAFKVDNNAYKKATQYALNKFDNALKERGVMQVVGT